MFFQEARLFGSPVTKIPIFLANNLMMALYERNETVLG